MKHYFARFLDGLFFFLSLFLFIAGLVFFQSHQEAEAARKKAARGYATPENAEKAKVFIQVTARITRVEKTEAKDLIYTTVRNGTDLAVITPQFRYCFYSGRDLVGDRIVKLSAMFHPGEEKEIEFDTSTLAEPIRKKYDRVEAELADPGIVGSLLQLDKPIKIE